MCCLKLDRTEAPQNASIRVPPCQVDPSQSKEGANFPTKMMFYLQKGSLELSFEDNSVEKGLPSKQGVAKILPKYHLKNIKPWWLSG